MLVRIFTALAVSLLMACEVFAHGTGFRVLDAKAASLEFAYSTGEKMAYCEARVFSPGDAKFETQSGMTDESGRLAFIPDSPGEWRVIVRDNQGHQCTASITVTEEFLSGSEALDTKAQGSGSPEGLELYIRALLGVSLIFNAAMIIRFWRQLHAH